MERLAERGGNLGAATVRLFKLLDEFGAAALERAIDVAIDKGVSDPQAVRQILDREASLQGKEPTIPVELPEDPRVRDLSVRPHDLETYDSIDPADGSAGDEEVNDDQ